MNQCNQASEPHGDVNQGMTRLCVAITELERLYDLLAMRLEPISVGYAVAGTAPDIIKTPEKTRSHIGQGMFSVESRVSDLSVRIGYQLDTLQL